LNISAILLAAGSGSRFGGDKLLHPLPDGTPIGVQAARNLLAAVPDVVAVVRPGDFPLGDLLEQEGCHVTFCPHAARGMGASLAHGVGARRVADGWLIALADMPLIKSATIAAVLREMEAGRDLVAPAFRGERGHPVGFGKRFAAQLLALDGDAGARDIMAAHKSELTLIECDDSAVVLDVDTRADMKKL
jgi:molybdenum cofactor cytidylyltransferase